MTVSIEWFLLDNFLMDYLILRLAAAMSGFPLRRWAGAGAALFGAAYAALSLSTAPFLGQLLPKLALGCIVALPLAHHVRDYPRALLYLYLSASLMGGLMLCVCMLFGGSVTGGILVGSLPVRAALFGTALCAALPRVMRTLLHLFRLRQRQLLMRLRLQNEEPMELTALADTGNLLIEPISGKPVIVLRPGILRQPLENCRPVAYTTVGGEGFLSAVEPKSVSIFLRRWHTLDAMVAESPVPIPDADALIPAELIPAERRKNDDQAMERKPLAVVSSAAAKAREGDFLHTFRRNITAAVPGSGGAGVDRTADERGTGSEKCLDRA